MIDARNTFRKVNQTINDFSPDQLEGLTNIIKFYRGENVNFKKNDWLIKSFPNKKYEDIEGLCKIANLDEITENDYTLNPGRYVGYSINVDNDFDYKGRMNEIKNELSKLQTDSDELTKIIKNFKL